MLYIIINHLASTRADNDSTNADDGSSSNSTDTDGTTSDTSDENEPPGIKKLNLVLNPNKKPERQEIVENAKDQYENDFGSLDMKQSFENLAKILWYSQLPCFDLQNITSKNRDELSLLKRCYWKGEKMSCASIFSTRPTDRGMCCSFNMKKAEETYHKSKYAAMVTEMQTLENKYRFEDDNELKDRYEKYIEDREPRTQAGQKKGLRLILDAHTDRVTAGSVYDNFRGFVTMVDGGDKYPLTARQSFLVKPGRDNYVAISALRVVAEDGIRSTEPSLRNCKFDDENPLAIHQKYSQANCNLECNIRYARNNTKKDNSTTGCTPWYYPRTDEQYTEVCDAWETKRFIEFMSNVPDGVCDKECLPDCTSTIYTSKVSAAPFRPCDHTNLGSSPMCDLENKDMNPSIWRQMVQDEFISMDGSVPDYAQPSPERMNNRRKYILDPARMETLILKEQTLVNPTYDAFENDIAIVNFYFDKSTVLEFKRDQRMKLEDYISQMGGLIGLGIGFSFISAVEIIYWITIRLFHNISSLGKVNSKKEQKKKSAANTLTKGITLASLKHEDESTENTNANTKDE